MRYVVGPALCRRCSHFYFLLLLFFLARDIYSAFTLRELDTAEQSANTLCARRVFHRVFCIQ